MGWAGDDFMACIGKQGGTELMLLVRKGRKKEGLVSLVLTWGLGGEEPICCSQPPSGKKLTVLVLSDASINLAYSEKIASAYE